MCDRILLNARESLITIAHYVVREIILGDIAVVQLHINNMWYMTCILILLIVSVRCLKDAKTMYMMFVCVNL